MVKKKGKEIYKSKIIMEVKKIIWESYKRREVDGNYYYKTEQKKETVDKFTVNTDQNGNTNHEFSLGQEDEYEIGVSTQDSPGNTVLATQDF